MDTYPDRALELFHVEVTLRQTPFQHQGGLASRCSEGMHGQLQSFQEPRWGMGWSAHQIYYLLLEVLHPSGSFSRTVRAVQAWLWSCVPWLSLFLPFLPPEGFAAQHTVDDIFSIFQLESQLERETRGSQMRKPVTQVVKGCGTGNRALGG